MYWVPLLYLGSNTHIYLVFSYFDERVSFLSTSPLVVLISTQLFTLVVSLPFDAQQVVCSVSEAFVTTKRMVGGKLKR